ncbi:hypothetical protein [Paraburkholderia aromaticivorans]|uniref:hypothetical protein n=1 Tax=Paraburkholderia aromaticivorans TaxID=2026199 RepID=UPI001455EAE3|nr:hypothetical protein [Paraburkholderia aromaticivorans]
MSVTDSIPVGTSGKAQKFRAVAYEPSDVGTYVLLEQQATGDWTKVDEYTDRLYPQNSHQEVLFLASEAGPGSPVQISGGFPRVRDYHVAGVRGGFDSSGTGSCNPAWRGDIRVTNGCASRIVKPRHGEIADGVTDAITLGAASKTGPNGLERYEIDPNAIREIVLHSDLFTSPRNYQSFQKIRAEREYEVRWAKCTSSPSITCYYEFALAYGGLGSFGTYDPMGYAAKAREFVLSRTRTNTARIEQQANTLRRSLRSGSETNFGRVLEVRGTSVKVAVAVQGFGNEQWVPIEYIYPAGVASAAFYNGEAQRPTLDQRLVLGE